MMAHSLMADERYEEAIPFYLKRIQRLEDLQDSQGAARARLGYVLALTQTGRHAEALDAGMVAQNWFRQNSDDANFARMSTNIGNVFHRLDDHAEAYRHYSAAADIFTRLGDTPALAEVCLNLGNVLSNLDRFEESDRMYERSEQLSEPLGNELFAQAAYNRAYLHYLRGHYSQALRCFSRLRDRFEATESYRHHALCDLDETEIYLQLNLSSDAAALAVRAAAQFEKIGLSYEHAKATAFYGVALLQLNRFDQALEVFREAQRVFELENNRYWIGLLDLYRAEVYFSLARPWEARELARRAKTSFERLSIPSKRIFSLVLLGRVAILLNDLAAARQCCDEVGEIIKDVKIPLVLFPYHVLCGQVAERLPDLDEAHTHYQAAARELELHQARLHHDDLRVTFFKGRQQAYDALVRLSLDDPEPGRALSSAYAWCERARSRGLIELLSHYSASGRVQIEQSVLSKIDQLREELNSHYARSQRETRPIRSSANSESIAAKELELARTLRDVSAVDPEYASLRQVSIATLESIQSILPKRTTLVEYFTCGDEILVFIISPDDSRIIRRLSTAGSVLSHQERLAFQMEKFLLGKDYVAAHSTQILDSARYYLRELYRSLISPFIAHLRTPHLAIVPHGSLHFLPFHSLWDGAKYLVDEFEISYAPSASVLKYCLEKPDICDSSPLLIGIADENVPLVSEEVSILSQLCPGARILTEKTATRQRFVDSSRVSTFLHIATHAIFRQDNPMFSSFKLADGWVTASDLFSISCQTNLVTLSGCQSGMSEVSGPDDLLGLMRGFLYAGAQSLLLSLWNVNDESTAALMTHFYREWQAGVTKSAALRSAMRAVRERYPNPFYWAPFFLVGTP
jgi:CHAT domain-containing protein/tetratricopeptide (TPR) repeat protein